VGLSASAELLVFPGRDRPKTLPASRKHSIEYLLSFSLNFILLMLFRLIVELTAN